MEKLKIEKLLKKVKKGQNVLLENRDGILKVSSSTDEMAITASTASDDENEFSTIIDGRYMGDVLSLCDDSEDVKLTPEKEGLRMKCGSVSVFFGKKRETVKTVPVLSGNEIEITDKKMKEKMLGVMHAASDSPSDAPLLRSVNISGSPDNVSVTALDGKRVSRRCGNENDNAFSISVFAGDARAICSLMCDDGRLFVSDRLLTYRDSDTAAACRIVDGTYYNFAEIRSKIKSAYEFTVDRYRLLSLVRLSAIAGSDVTVKVNEDSSIRIESRSASMDTDGSIPVSSVGTLPNTSFRLSSQYLLQAVSSLDGDEVKVSFFVSTSPVVLSAEGDSAQEEIMMPMILQ